MAESKDYIIRNTEDGSVSISADVVAIIAGEAMHSVEGFGGAAQGLTGELAELIGRRGAAQGVRVTPGEDSVAIDVYISVRFGYSVTQVSRQVQEAVFKAVEDMTGITVSAVNVSVSGIAFQKQSKA